MKTRVVIESPLRGSDGGYEKNRMYSERCVRDSLKRGEAPFASHVFYGRILNDQDAAEREHGMQAGSAWGAVAELCAVYVDLGISDGMAKGIERAKANGIPIRRRRLSDGSDTEWKD